MRGFDGAGVRAIQWYVIDEIFKLIIKIVIKKVIKKVIKMVMSLSVVDS